MKRLLIAVAAGLFVGGVSAADIYYGLGEGNTDLSTKRLAAEDFAGVQPSVGDSLDRYQGWADGNPDLFKASGAANSTDDPSIYNGLGGNPDLQF